VIIDDKKADIAEIEIALDGDELRIDQCSDWVCITKPMAKKLVVVLEKFIKKGEI